MRSYSKKMRQNLDLSGKPSSMRYDNDITTHDSEMPSLSTLGQLHQMLLFPTHTSTSIKSSLGNCELGF